MSPCTRGVKHVRSWLKKGLFSERCVQAQHRKEEWREKYGQRYTSSRNHHNLERVVKQSPVTRAVTIRNFWRRFLVRKLIANDNFELYCLFCSLFFIFYSRSIMIWQILQISSSTLQGSLSLGQKSKYTHSGAVVCGFGNRTFPFSMWLLS